jgi:hypothetical protein
MVGHKLGEFAPTRLFKGHTTKVAEKAATVGAARRVRRPRRRREAGGGRGLDIMIQAQATARFVRTSAQKAGLVLDLIRGKDVNRALATLQFTRKAIAADISKVLRSAIANAPNKEGLQRRRRQAVRVGVLRRTRGRRPSGCAPPRWGRAVPRA